MNQLQSWWKGLSQRDQRLFAVWLAGMAVAALVWSWSALAAAQDRAQTQLATEWKVLGNMRVQADEWQQLRQRPAAGGNVRGVNVTAVTDSIAKFGLSPEILQTLDTENQVALQGMVPFDKWVEWVAFAQKDMRLIVQKAKATRTDLPGMVEIQALLELGKDER
ncbi:type II secretion system protein M [Hydrogenophaga taeniospiralis]|uniref:type II secretion system protein GspM n=1 Tax=Hydrogenophaga taeniospiralis TaxID=65656 RepID=UPI001CFA0D7D|nr:type II secretion system protein GspM [Hydrogenophaga taeniospiralis]MCB4365483.1 type II secretion system protein M [Hydrogenophaga taeniospiralis]